MHSSENSPHQGSPSDKKNIHSSTQVIYTFSLMKTARSNYCVSQYNSKHITFFKRVKLDEFLKVVTLEETPFLLILVNVLQMHFCQKICAVAAAGPGGTS